jgi:hypothetical protein
MDLIPIPLEKYHRHDLPNYYLSNKNKIQKTVKKRNCGLNVLKLFRGSKKENN